MTISQDAPRGSSDFSHLPTMPIAIIGMACRASGGVDTPSKFWDLLVNKRSGFSTDAGNRFSLQAHWHPQNDMNGTLSPKGCHFIQEDLSRFDAPFFNISAAEALATDPQQRLALEVTYEALESAGVPMSQSSGSRTSVYASMYNKDYAFITTRDPEATPKYQALGIGNALLANRLSYFFNWKGPSFTLDTGSSGSLVALHQACQSIRTGEATMSVVVGANLILDPCFMVSMSNMGYFSEDGRCFSFDARGNGYGRGEGMAAVIVKPLDRALADGDPIRAVIRNTHCNQDGRTPGITLPSQEAQATMIREAYQQAKLSMRDTAYFESHGTGTPAGDPIEAAAIGTTIGRDRYPGDKLYVGTAKSNLGHTEACASVIGLIKVALSLENSTIVPNYDFQTPNPSIPFDDYNIAIATEVMPWPNRDVHRASINAFGYGGTNAHAIIEDFKGFMHHNVLPRIVLPIRLKARELGTHQHLFALSAKTAAALQGRADHLKTYLGATSNPDVSSIAYTLLDRREHMTKRSFIIALSATDAIAKLATPVSLPTGSAASGRPQIAFCFTGQGAQWASMGIQLIDQFPLAKRILQQCTTIVHNLGASWDLIEELRRSEESSNISRAEISQPLCTALQIMLVEILRSFGVQPSAGVFGHSSGEIAAAYAAGYLTMIDAMTASYFRGLWCSKLSQVAPGAEGAMMAVGLSEQDIEPYLSALAPLGSKACVACVNSPSSITVSGDKAAIQQLKKWLDEAGVFARELRVDTAYHSHHMMHIAEQYRRSMASLKPVLSGATPMFSSVYGKQSDTICYGADYWVANMVSQVKFLQAVKSFAEAHKDPDIDTIVIEIGPHAALAGPLKEILRQPALSAANVSYLPSLVRKKCAATCVLELIGQLFLRRVNIEYKGAQIGDEQVIHDLPKYSWDRSQRYWSESRLSSDYRLRAQPRHHLLGVRSADWNPVEPSWRLLLRQHEQPWLRGHTVLGQVMYPAGGFIATALQACREYAELHLAGRGPPSLYSLKDVEIAEALMIPEGNEGIEMKTTVRKIRRARDAEVIELEFTIFSCSSDKSWSENCFGTAVIDYRPLSSEAAENMQDRLLNSQNRLTHHPYVVDTTKFYKRLDRIGYNFSQPFCNLEDIYADQARSIALINVPDTAAHMPKGFELPQMIHPATADSLVSTVFPALFNNGLQATFVPTHIGSFTISASVQHVPGDKYAVAARLLSRDQQKAGAEVIALNGATFMQISDLHYTALPGVKADAEAETIGIVHKVAYEPDADRLSGQELQELVGERGASTDEVDVKLFDEASYRIAKRTLEELDSQTKSLKSPPHMSKLLAYLKDEVQSRGSSPFSELPEACLRSKVTAASAVGEMVYRVGDRLAEIIRGEIDPLSIMLQDNLLNQYYQDDMVKRCYPTLHKYIQLMRHKNPAMRVLEIGAGTGGATRHVLQALGDEYEHFDFTDISSGFFIKAEEELSTPGSSIAFRKLNIEQDPAQQGFSAGSYDLVVAANCLHATKSMTATMRNVRSLLKPGGTLLLMELTAIKLYTGMIFGTLPGWWLSEEEWRAGGPQMDLDRWNAVLRDTGFSGIGVHQPDFSSDELKQTEILISKAVDTEAQRGSLRDWQVKILPHVGCGPIVSPVRPLLESSALGASIDSPILLVVFDEGEQGLLDNVNEQDFDDLKKHLLEAAGVVWLTAGKDYNAAPAQGLLRTLHSETGLQAQLLSLDDKDIGDAEAMVARVRTAINDIQRQVEDHRTAVEPEYTDSIQIPRLIDFKEADDYVLNGTSGTGAFDTTHPRFRPDACYLFSGGLGGLGRATTEWMILNGAKQIAILTRKFPEEGSPRHDWYLAVNARSLGTTVHIIECDVSSAQAVQKALATDLSGMYPIRGVIQAAMTLADCTFANMSHSAWHSTLRPKLQGSYNLHKYLHKQHNKPHTLDFFILLSSIAGLIGNAGQANYAASCTYQDALARHRVQAGLAATSIDLGVIADAGFVAERDGAVNNVTSEGFVSVRLEWFFRLLAWVMAHPAQTPDDAHIAIGLKTGSHTFNRDPLFSHVAVTRRTSSTTTTASKPALNNNTRALLSTAPSLTEAKTIVLRAFSAHVSKLLAVPADHLTADQRLTDLGADSLVAVELRSWIKRELDADVKVAEVLGGESIGRLVERVVGASAVVPRF